MRIAHLAAVVTLLLAGACAGDDSKPATDLPDNRTGYEEGVSYLLREQLDLDLTDSENSCAAKAFVAELDTDAIGGSGIDATGMQSFPLYYTELGRVLDAPARSDMASGIAGCLKSKCGSLASGQRFGRDLVALLLADRDFHDETSDLLRAMSDGASNLPLVCDDGSTPATTTTRSSRPDPVIACLPPGSTYEDGAQLLRTVAPLTLNLELETAHARVGGVAVEFAIDADPAARTRVIDAMRGWPGVVDVRPLSEGCD